MLDDPAFAVEPEDVHPCPVGIARPFLPGVEDHAVPLCEGAEDVHALPGILTRHALEVFDEPVLPVAHARVVLDVPVADVVLDGFARAGLVERQFVEGLCGLLVGLAHEAPFKAPPRRGQPMASTIGRRPAMSEGSVRVFS